MRNHPIYRAAALTLGAAALIATGACSDILTVTNPNVIDAGSVDPVQDAVTLANSAQQSFASSLGWLNMYSAWFTGEADVAETFPTRNEFGRRDVVTSNVSHNGDVWFPLSQAAAGNHLVLGLALPTPTTNINFVRANTWLGFSFVMMAEQFCQGVVYGGPLLTTNAMLDSAIVHFTDAITIGTANASTAAVALANAARVGRARAYLQRGNKASALVDANATPAGFNYSFAAIDDPANRTRLSNRMWQFTFDRGSISVSAAYRVTDSRIAYLPPPNGFSPQDATTGPFYVQQKYPAYTTSYRVASKLEADYIAAESQTSTEQLALIGLRRTAGGQPAYSGPTDANSVLTELMRQKHIDFWLEGKRLGDFRRNPANVANMPVPGAVYFKPGFSPIGNQTCYPLPLNETDNNPNIP